MAGTMIKIDETIQCAACGHQGALPNGLCIRCHGKRILGQLQEAENDLSACDAQDEE